MKRIIALIAAALTLCVLAPTPVQAGHHHCGYGVGLSFAGPVFHVGASYGGYYHRPYCGNGYYGYPSAHYVSYPRYGCGYRSYGYRSYGGCYPRYRSYGYRSYGYRGGYGCGRGYYRRY